jgi:hypothetical protein
MARHKKITVTLPEWVEKSGDACLRSVAEDVYYAKALAVDHGAAKDPRCSTLMSAAQKSLKVMENESAGSASRCREGDRAARKFWEAKVCARG